MWTRHRAFLPSMWFLATVALASACDSKTEQQPVPPGYPQQQAYPQQQVYPQQQAYPQQQGYPQQQVQPGQPVAGQAQPVQPAPGQPVQQPGPAQNPVANAMNALGQAAATAPVNHLPWDSLSKALPVNAAGWTMDGQIEGESSSMMGISVSEAKCTLKQGNMSAKVKILDTSMNPMLAMPFNMARSLRKDSSSERVGPINFGTYPGTQTFHKKSNRAEVTVLVRSRILVTVSVSNAPNEAPAVAVAQQVNYPVIEQLLGK